jgi:hypothetical protein
MYIQLPIRPAARSHLERFFMRQHPAACLFAIAAKAGSPS